jgi:hypothetical protein
MYEAVLGDAAFYRLLLRLDEDLAEAERALGCQVCGTRLHVGDYRRKPRGVALQLPERFAVRFSFCCADRDCRKRRTPACLRFLGRKVYLGAIVVLISALRCGVTPWRMRRLHELVGVSRHTVARWRDWWREVLPGMRCWVGLAGTLIPPPAIADLPASLLERFAGSPDQRLLALLRWLSPLSCASHEEHAA